MRVLFDNIDFSSRSGPNGFGLKLATQLNLIGCIPVNTYENPDVQLSFIQATAQYAPLVQRLDGIWFNKSQAWQQLNIPIKSTYDAAKVVIAQSNFDAKLICKFFGKHSDMRIIHNGTFVNDILEVDPLSAPTLRDVERVWTCASAWRPHKRLAENIRYFKEFSNPKDCLIIAGSNPDVRDADTRIFYAGDLDYMTLVSLYRATDIFLHTAYLDHCPNVIVDARAAGCQIVCSSSGGTEEIAGLDAIVIDEDEWDFEPCELYNPPPLDFSRARKGKFDYSIDIVDTAKEYQKALKDAM